MYIGPWQEYKLSRVLALHASIAKSDDLLPPCLDQSLPPQVLHKTRKPSLTGKPQNLSHTQTTSASARCRTTRHSSCNPISLSHQDVDQPTSSSHTDKHTYTLPPLAARGRLPKLPCNPIELSSAVTKKLRQGTSDFLLWSDSIATTAGCTTPAEAPSVCGYEQQEEELLESHGPCNLAASNSHPSSIAPHVSYRSSSSCRLPKLPPEGSNLIRSPPSPIVPKGSSLSSLSLPPLMQSFTEAEEEEGVPLSGPDKLEAFYQQCLKLSQLASNFLSLKKQVPLSHPATPSNCNRKSTQSRKSSSKAASSITSNDKQHCDAPPSHLSQSDKQQRNSTSAETTKRHRSSAQIKYPKIKTKSASSSQCSSSSSATSCGTLLKSKTSNAFTHHSDRIQKLRQLYGLGMPPPCPDTVPDTTPCTGQTVDIPPCTGQTVDISPCTGQTAAASCPSSATGLAQDDPQPPLMEGVGPFCYDYDSFFGGFEDSDCEGDSNLSLRDALNEARLCLAQRDDE
eukprot:GHVQ01028699.1.p1 GENE.GHVQ01028699.1~~GHVQ01028699.1.p1  ORF type:complete len:510 (+),score=94.85 GHVQ01028699.1:109-1638(+)